MGGCWGGEQSPGSLVVQRTLALQRRRGMDIKQMKAFVSQELKGLKQEHRLLSLRRSPPTPLLCMGPVQGCLAGGRTGWLGRGEEGVAGPLPSPCCARRHRCL